MIIRQFSSSQNEAAFMRGAQLVSLLLQCCCQKLFDFQKLGMTLNILCERFVFVIALSFLATVVTQVVAKDADEPNTLHTKIAYSLINQEPNYGTVFFAVHKDSGTIYVNNPTLDREVFVTIYTDI